MSRTLRIQILEYLKEHDAVDKKIDIALNFLEPDDSRERRSNLSNALEYLKKENLIELQGRSLNMLSTSGGQMPSKFDANLKASITIQGENYLKLATEAIEVITKNRQNSPLKISTDEKMLVFISHSNKDKEIVTVFMDKILKLILKIDTADIFFTSLNETTIKSGDDFRRSIKQHIEGASMVIQIITENYLKSEVCLIEMGASWVLNNKLVPFILPPIEYGSVGFLHQPNQVLKLNSKEDIIQFIDEEKHDNNKIKHSEINRYVSEFLSSIEEKLTRPSIINTTVTKSTTTPVDEFDFVENDIVEIENRHGVYIYLDKTLVPIIDERDVKILVRNPKIKKILKQVDAEKLLNKDIIIPPLHNCQRLKDEATQTVWVLLNNERRFTPAQTSSILYLRNKVIYVIVPHDEIMKYREGDKLMDIAEE